MALVDLIADLENFKYGHTDYDKIDAQIKDGVDFFPDDDATGFTPKTNLESEFKKASKFDAKSVMPSASPTEFQTGEEIDIENEDYGVNTYYENFAAGVFDQNYTSVQIGADSIVWPHAAISYSKTWEVFDHYPGKPGQTFSDTLHVSDNIEIHPFVAPKFDPDDVINDLGRYSGGQSPASYPYPTTDSDGLPISDNHNWSLDLGEGDFQTVWPTAAPHPQGATVNRFSQRKYPYPITDGAGLHNWGDEFESIFDRFRVDGSATDYTDMEGSKKYTAFGRVGFTSETDPSTNSYFNPPFKHLSLDISPFQQMSMYDTDNNLLETTEANWRLGSIHIGVDDTNSGAGILSGFPPNYYAKLQPIASRVSMWDDYAGNFKMRVAGTFPPNDDNMQVGDGYSPGEIGINRPGHYQNYPWFTTGWFWNYGDQQTFFGMPVPKFQTQDLITVGDLYTIVSQPAGHRYNSPFQPLPPYDFMTTPIANFASRYTDEWTPSLTLTIPEVVSSMDGGSVNVGNIPEQTYEGPPPVTNRIALGAHGSPFMTTPIANFVSSYAGTVPHTPSLTLTVPLVKSSMNSGTTNVGDIPEQTFDNSYDAFGAHGYPFMVTPINTFESDYPKGPSLTWGDEDGTMTGPVAGNPPTHELKRGVYNEYPLENQFSWTNVGNVPYGSTGDWVGGQIGSIHISPGGEIKAGTQYGAMTDQTFELLAEDTSLIDVAADVQEDLVTQFANLEHVGGNSAFSDDDNNYTVPTGFTGQITHHIPAITITQTAVKYSTGDDKFGDYAGEDNVGPFHIGDNVSISTLTSNDNRNKIKDFTTYEKSNSLIPYSGDFINISAGQDENNKFGGVISFKEAADPNQMFNLGRQPFILREIGNQWGVNPVSTDSENGLGQFLTGADNILGNFVRGAPSFTGLVDRNLADKVRIVKFLLTSQGIGFIAKQFVLQALNPTIESKIWWPGSIIGLPQGSHGDTPFWENLGDIGSLLVGLALPISHTDRHIGNLRYEDINPLKKVTDDTEPGKSILDIPVIGMPAFYAINKFVEGYGPISRISMQSNPEVIKKVEFLGVQKGGKDWGVSFPIMNPNKYLFPISSAPKSIERGVPIFTGRTEIIDKDILKITTAGGPPSLDGEKRGGTFNSKTNEMYTHDDGLIKRHSTLAYADLYKELSYSENLQSPFEINDPFFDPTIVQERKNGKFVRISGAMGLTGVAGDTIVERHKGLVINKDIGDLRTNESTKYQGKHLGAIKGTAKTDNVDKVNITPYGSEADADGTIYPNGKGGTSVKDFIKFRFKDVINGKYIIFRAILNGITDSISTDYASERYIGRPDKLHVYQGADRTVSFNFKVYPKTKQELPVLMEKLNYLVGLCYPKYNANQRMISPFINLTMGDLFNEAPGYLSSLSLTVEDAGTWEIEEGLQFPHYISAQCEFIYIGKNAPVMQGKFYDAPFLGTNTIKPWMGTVMDGERSSDTPMLSTDRQMINRNDWGREEGDPGIGDTVWDMIYPHTPPAV